jgi:hypothetical protein
VLQTFNTAWSHSIGIFDSDHLFARMGRVLLFLASFLLLALPFTQHIWTWDRFLHGGHDFETNMLLILCTLCLVLVLMQVCRQAIKILFAFLDWLPQWKSTSLPCASLSVVCDHFNRPPVDARNLSLRI